MKIRNAFNAPHEPPPAVERRSAENFEARIASLVDEAEHIRLNLMTAHGKRMMATKAATILFIMLGAMGFGWFLLIQGRVDTAVTCMMIGVGLSYVVHVWSEGPLKQYKTDYKTKFMPKLAHAIGRFKFYPARGISAKIINRTGIVPAHHLYKAEDCFMGLYKGVKVIFSEARLYPSKRQTNPVFDGIFVLLEIPGAPLKGHSILTSDGNLVRQNAKTRWKTLQHVPIHNGVESGRFQMYSDSPDAAQDLLNERIFQELSEASAVFDQAPVSVVFFAKKFMFLMIPYAQNMFEPSNIHLPIKTEQHASQCRREIEQILEIIDVFDLYQDTEARPE